LELSGPAAFGIATSISRLLAPEPRAPPSSALLISAPSLPAAEREKEALRALGADVVELPRALPEVALEAAQTQPTLHFDAPRAGRRNSTPRSAAASLSSAPITPRATRRASSW